MKGDICFICVIMEYIVGSQRAIDTYEEVNSKMANENSELLPLLENVLRWKDLADIT